MLFLCQQPLARALLEIVDGPEYDRSVSERVQNDLARLRRRMAAAVRLDFFDAPERRAADEMLERLAERLRPSPTPAGRRSERTEYHGRTWVTRQDIFVDRIAGAWLIARFIDPDAQFKFVPAQGYLPAAGELRFDMFEGEFTHEGDRCTFETLLNRFALVENLALRALGDTTLT